MMKSLKTVLLGAGIAAIYTGSAVAAGSCGGSSLMIYGGCKMGTTGLIGLYSGSQNVSPPMPVEETAMLQPYSAPVDISGLEREPRREKPGKSKRVTKIAPTKPDDQAPHQLPIYMGDTSLLVFRSKNKQLSKHGPDTQAIMMMRCRKGKLNILLDFPGYPMSDVQEKKVVAYETNRGVKRRTGFDSSNQMSVVGIWQSDQAKRFAKDIFGGDVVRISTRDTEHTNIVASFSVEEQQAHAAGFQQACGIT